MKARSIGAELQMISEKACRSFMDDFVENGMVRLLKGQFAKIEDDRFLEGSIGSVASSSL